LSECFLQGEAALKNQQNMKKILFFLMAALIVASCAFSLPGKFTELADKVAQKGADFTPEQWEKTNAQFEQKVINAAIGKYTATALKCGASDVVKQVKALLKQVPDSVNSAIEGAKGFLEELGQ